MLYWVLFTVEPKEVGVQFRSGHQSPLPQKIALGDMADIFLYPTGVQGGAIDTKQASSDRSFHREY